MSRLLAASRTRPDIDLPNYLGMYEFSVVPLSLFTPDDSFYYPKDKGAITTELRNFEVAKENGSIEEEFNFNARKVIVIDGMAIVKKINIVNSQISICDDFFKCFTDMITNETEDCDEFRV